MKTYNKRTFNKAFKNPNQIYNPNSPIMFHLKYSDTMHACREIVSKDSFGSGFIFTYQDKSFLVTAAHVVINKNRIHRKVLSITTHNGETYTFQAELYYHFNKSLDLCVIKLPDDYVSDASLTYQYGPVEVGEEHFFFGYPGTIDSTFGFDLKHGTPLPVIRRGIISHFGVLDDINFMWIDTIAVGGFSGSPLVKFDKQQKGSVIGIITNGNVDLSEIYDKEGNELDMYSVHQTGFTKAIHILYVIDIIEQNNLISNES